jgi:DNA segregation ATPase FtsK/SpoIIIE, S-DNA-T family
MIAAEDLGGYSLMVPADSISRSQEALEASASLAAGKFMQAVDQYLEIHPHEATNLSIAIFDRKVRRCPVRSLGRWAKRLHKEAGLRCDLIITHRDQERLRRIYRNQNVRLGAENISQTARGFSVQASRDVRANHEHAGPPDVRDVDLAFLHDAISHHAQPTWVVEVGPSDELSITFDPAAGRRPRRRVVNRMPPGLASI